jgi:hypothetical protein
VRNEQFAHALGHALHRPAILRVPATVIRLMMGEASVLVLGGQRALPKRLEAAGFAFRWYDLEEALGDVVGEWSVTGHVRRNGVTMATITTRLHLTLFEPTDWAFFRSLREDRAIMRYMAAIAPEKETRRVFAARLMRRMFL